MYNKIISSQSKFNYKNNIFIFENTSFVKYNNLCLKNKKFCIVFFLICAIYSVNAQKNDSIKKMTATEVFLSQPNFSMYKDNYFISGTAFKEEPTINNSDAKFQVSLKYRIDQKPVFDNVFAYITYTQKSFWDIYSESSPFGDINFNPGIGLIRPYMNKKGRFGYYSIMLEHESNGKDSLSSRSWNFISLNWSAEINSKLLIEAKAVLPFGYKTDNPDLFKYIGYGDIGFTYIFIPRKIYAKIIVKKGTSWDWKGSIETQLFFKPIQSSNLYFMLQGFHGYGENLLEYNKEVSMMRFGIVIKPNFMNFF